MGIFLPLLLSRILILLNRPKYLVPQVLMEMDFTNLKFNQIYSLHRHLYNL